jgi:hypothetical protein
MKWSMLVLSWLENNGSDTLNYKSDWQERILLENDVS